MLLKKKTIFNLEVDEEELNLLLDSINNEIMQLCNYQEADSEDPALKVVKDKYKTLREMKDSIVEMLLQ